MINVLEESFRNVIAKMFGTDENYDVIINPEKGDFEIWRNRMVVEDGHVEDPNLEVALSEAQKIDADCEVGEEVTDEVHFADFGRRAILNLRQTLSSKILELQKDNLYAKYRDLIGSIISVRKRFNKVMAHSTLSRFNYLIVRSVRHAESDIIFYGIFKEIHMLEYH